MFYEIFKVIALLVLLIFFSEFSKVIGGLLWVVMTAFLRIPYLGKVYHFLFFDKVKISALFKFATWIVNSSGILLGLVLYYSIFGQSKDFMENLAILLCASGVIANFLYRIWYLDMIDVKEVFHLGSDVVRQYWGKEAADMMNNDPEIKTKLLFASFVDTFIPQFLRILITIGVFYFAAFQVGLLQLKSGVAVPPDLYECLKYAFSFLPIEKIDGSEAVFTGVFWECINVFFGILIFLWIVAFFNVALSRISTTLQQISDPEIEKKNPQETRIESNALLSNTFSHVKTLLEELKGKMERIGEQRVTKANRSSETQKKSRRKASKGKGKKKKNDDREEF